MLGGSTVHVLFLFGLQDTLGFMSCSLGSERSLLSDKNISDADDVSVCEAKVHEPGEGN